MGRYWEIDSGCFTLGMRVRKVLFSWGSMRPVVKASLQSVVTADLVACQNFWKNIGSRLSGPGVFSGLKEWIAWKTSDVVKGLVRSVWSWSDKKLVVGVAQVFRERGRSVVYNVEKWLCIVVRICRGQTSNFQHNHWVQAYDYVTLMNCRQMEDASVGVTLI